jgi:CopG family transcriptional regulator, nickel-responsive regulator
MSELARISLSLESSLMVRLEQLVEEGGYTNRSEFIRDLIRERLVAREWEDEKAEVIGVVTMVYDHHAPGLGDRLTDIQHDHHDAVLASTHVHLDHDHCAEMIMMKGRAKSLNHLADQLRQQRGVLHASLSLGSTGTQLS